jgi:hypothetical protein
VTAARVRTGLIWVLRLAFYALFAALLLQRCTQDDAGASIAGFAMDPESRQVECFENNPGLFYDADGNCFSQDPTLLTAAERAQVAVVPNARMDSLDPSATVTPGGVVVAGPMPPGLVDPRSSAAAPPPALAVPGSTGTGSTGTGLAGTGSTDAGSTTPVGSAPGGQPASSDGTQTGQAPAAPVTGQSNPGATAGDGDGDSAAPASPSLAYIEEDGRTDSVTKGPTINGIQVWVHTPSRTLYADSCEVLRTITGRDQQFGPTPEAPGYGAICPQL